MKKLSTLFILLFSFTSLIAQERGLIVNYNQQINFDVEKMQGNVSVIANEGNNDLKKALLESMKRISQYTLTTTQEKAVSQKVEKINNDQNEIGMTISFGNSRPLFMDFRNNMYYTKSRNFDKDFEIKDSLTHYDWQITREKKKILNFDCRKATAKDGKKDIIAWFAPKLPYKSGPDGFTGLPGLILELIIKKNNKKKMENHFWATDVQIKDDINIELPKFENPLTKKEYNKKAEEMFKKFKEMQGGGVDRD